MGEKIKLQVWLLGIALSFGLFACGSDLKLNPSEGQATEIPAAAGTVPIPPADSTPQEYFEIGIFPLLDSAAKGCTSCHNLENPENLPDGYFVVLEGSAGGTWDWARPRRRSPVDFADTAFTNSEAQTLRAKALENHETFKNWSTSDRALLDAWTNLEEPE